MLVRNRAKNYTILTAWAEILASGGITDLLTKSPDPESRTPAPKGCPDFDTLRRAKNRRSELTASIPQFHGS